ncbi:GAF and ANTAR domain-containing protein [Arthrobacter sp. TmT3-37]
MDSADIKAFLAGLAQEAACHFSAPDNEVLAAVTLLRPRTKATVGSSGDRAQVIDEVQYRFDDGPCLRAARENTVYVVTDFHTETRFGQYSVAIHDHGLRSAIATPIPLDGGAAAALDLYSTHVDAFGEAAVDAAGSMAREASQSLRLAVRIAHLSEANRHLHTAMESRTAIQVAAGIIMAQNRCTHDTAMSILKAASSARNTKLRDVAEIVMHCVGQTAPNTHFD